MALGIGVGFLYLAAKLGMVNSTVVIRPGGTTVTIPPTVIPPPKITVFDNTWHMHGTAIIDQAGVLSINSSFPNVQPVPPGNAAYGPYGDDSAQIGWQDYGQQFGPVMTPATFSVTQESITITPTGAPYSVDGFVAFYYHFKTAVTVNGITAPNLDLQYFTQIKTDSPGGSPAYTTFPNGSPKSFHKELGLWPGKVDCRKLFNDWAVANNVVADYDSMGVEVGGEGYRGTLKAKFSNPVFT